MNENFTDALNTPETRSRLRKAVRFTVVAVLATAALVVVSRQVSSSDTPEQL